MIESFNRPPRLFTATPWGFVVWEDSTMARVFLAVSLWSLLLASLLPSILVPAVFRLSLWISEIVQG
ncbi:hypothetical protein ASJ36_02040 [Aeromonas sp. ARM81]|nr:hypothetical protein ASJ36_02040 [Aeromonas sp. ARM81]